MSLPTRECGLKFYGSTVVHYGDTVAPHAGVWIEIRNRFVIFVIISSLPTRECGLKYLLPPLASDRTTVAPHAGVWIEILRDFLFCSISFVAPHAGVWIEIP